MAEDARRYEAPVRLRLPDLAECLPDGASVVSTPPLKLRATYYDTADLRLTRAGAALRFCRGDDEPWSAHLPGTGDIATTGPASTPPARLLALLTVYARGAELVPLATLATVRRTHQLCGRDSRVAVEVVDDTVSVTEGGRVSLRYREITLSRRSGKARLLERVETALRDAGATATAHEPASPLMRALGGAASVAADWPAVTTLPRRPTVADVVTAAIQRDIARIVAHDPLVRLRATVGADDTAVHQMRVGCRRLRSDLRTFGPVLDRAWCAQLRRELAWLAAALGGARDAEVLRARLQATAQRDPVAVPDPASVARIDAALAARQQDAVGALDEAMGEQRYVRLLDALLDAAREPRLARHGPEPAEVVLPRLVARPFRRLARGGDGIVGAGQLDPMGPDDAWHAVRINGKRARYAVDAVAGVLASDATALAKALGAVQDLLGEHQDAAVAAQTWLSIAAADPEDHALAVTAGRLYERERAAVRAARLAFPAAWRAASRRRLTQWLR